MEKYNFIQYEPTSHKFICQGEWVISNLSAIKKQLEQMSLAKTDTIILNGKDIKKLDSSGAFLIIKWIDKLEKINKKLILENFTDQQNKLISFTKNQEPAKKIPKIKGLYWIAALGRYSLEQVEEFFQYINFVGKLYFESLRVIFRPIFWRLNVISSVIIHTGASALPIVALLSFMIGIVIAYEMGNELIEYGANVYIVNLIGASVLREFGPLLAAILVSGRTGSSFTAQIGIMKINAEIDAIDTMGITPEQLLIIPRIIGLLIVLPLLTIWADIFGVLGGMLMAKNVLHIGLNEFLLRFQHVVPLRSLLVGLGKAPVFALVIASIGCFQGMQVQGSAESIGFRTTRSVVLAIFFIIIIDAIFTIILSDLKL